MSYTSDFLKELEKLSKKTTSTAKKAKRRADITVGKQSEDKFTRDFFTELYKLEEEEALKKNQEKEKTRFDDSNKARSTKSERKRLREEQEAKEAKEEEDKWKSRGLYALSGLSAPTANGTIGKDKMKDKSSGTMKGVGGGGRSFTDVVKDNKKRVDRYVDIGGGYKINNKTLTLVDENHRQIGKYDEKTGIIKSEDGTRYFRIKEDGSLRWYDEGMKALGFSDNNSWFQAGAFEDGYDFGDVSKSILSTGRQLGRGVVRGVVNIGETTIDTAAYLGGLAGKGIGYLAGADDSEIAGWDNMVSEFIAKDIIDEDAIAKVVVPDIVSTLTNGQQTEEENALVGGKMTGLAESGGQLLTQAGLQYIGVPWFVTSGVYSFGSETENALKQDATLGEAGFSASFSALGEIATEKIFGAFKFQGKGLDDGLKTVISRNIKNKTARTLANLGLDLGGEGVEEVLSGRISAAGQKLSYATDKEIRELFSSEDAWDAFIGGAILGGGTNVANIVKSAVNKVDPVTHLTENEQKVVDRVYKDKVTEAEKDGKKLDGAEKNKLYDGILKDLEKGYISTDVIEEVLGGDTYKQYQDTIDSEDAAMKELEDLYEGDELEQQKNSFKGHSKLGNIREQLGIEVSDKVKGDRLIESYNEKIRRKQAFTADLTKYSDKAQAVVQKAMNSGVLNNTNRSHELVDLVAKIAGDKGIDFDFTNNEKLKESGFAIEGSTINGFVTKDGVTLNVQSKKALNSVVGHEIAHVLEGTELYNELQKIAFEYAETKGEYKDRLRIANEAYRNVEGYQGVDGFNKIKSEVLADIVGDYLFTDPDFINTLSTNHRNVFQKMYDEVKYLFKVATAGSKEAKELEKLKKAFDNAYRAATSTDSKTNTQYSVSTDSEGKKLSKGQQEFFKDSKMVDADGNLKVMYHGTQKGGYHIFDPNYSDDGISLFFVDRNDVAMSYSGTSETYAARTFRTADDFNNFFAEIGTPEYEVQEKNGKLYLYDDGDLVAESENGEEIYEEFRDLSGLGYGDVNYKTYLNLTNPLVVDAKDANWDEIKIPKEHLAKFNESIYLTDDPYGYIDTAPTRSFAEYAKAQGYDGVIFNNLRDNGGFSNGSEGSSAVAIAFESNQVKSVANTNPTGNSDIRYSISTDTNGKTLTKNQQDFFKDSVVRDESGNLLTMYHGTSRGGHTVFDTYGGNYGLFGIGSYFTSSKNIGEAYTKKGRGMDPQVYEVYLNIKNPMDMDAQANPAEWAKAFEDVDFPESGTNEAFYRAVEEYYADQWMSKWEVSDIIRESIEYGMGYDGLTHIGGGRVNPDGERHRVYIAFQPEQIKKTDNVNPTTDPDIRYSLSSIANTFFGDENMSAYEFKNANYTETQGYKDYVEQCLNNYRQSRTDFDEGKARKAIEDSIHGIIRVAIASKEAGYDIYDDATKRSKKDSKKRLLFSSLEPNSDYFTSNDISTICDKRKNFAEIYDDIVKADEKKGVPPGKRFFDNVDNYFYLHKLMADKGLTQPCRQCYVESMRKNLAPMANAFLRLVKETNPNNMANDQLYHQKGKNKGGIKTNNAATRMWVIEKLAEYGMTVNDLSVQTLTTEDGLAQLKIQAPMIYEAFNSFYGQSKPKMPKAATPFRFGELTALLTDEHGKIKKSLVDKINATGGFRLQSYSDFQIQNYTDVLQAIFEAGTLGLKGHAYTKVPAFLDATEGTNLKRNISIFMYKDGDEWKLDKNDSFPYDLEEIYDIVNADETGNTGIIAVSQNTDMSAWIMANDYVGYGIPFHKSGLKMGTVRDTVVKTEDGREVKGYTGTKDHTKQQTEVWAKASADHKALTKVKKGINIYEFWDFENKGNLPKNKLIERNVKKYIDACEKAGYLPKFREYVMNNGAVLNAVLKYAKQLGFASQDATIDDISFKYKGYTIPYGYYKFLGDFGMFTPDGKASAQETLSLENYDFDKAVDFFANSEELRRNEILQQFSNGKERTKYRESNLSAGELADIVKQKRKEIAEGVASGELAPSKKSLSKDGEQQKTYGRYNIRGEDVALDIAPVQKTTNDIAPTSETIAKPVQQEELFPDEQSPLQELENLQQQRVELEDRLRSAMNASDVEAFERIGAVYDEVMDRIGQLEAEESALENDRMSSITDADAPPEIAPYYENTSDTVPITKKLVSDIAKEVKASLALSNKQMADVRNIITEYSSQEMPSRDDLFHKIKDKFGTYTEAQTDDVLAEAKSVLRSYRIKVDDFIKSEIADYGDLMHRNFGKVRFSKEGIPVDSAYEDLASQFPSFFPSDIISPTDQLMQIIDVANTDASLVFEQEIDNESIMAVADTIINRVSEYRNTQREKTANKLGREAFESLLKDESAVPPVDLNRILTNKTLAERRTGTSGDIAPVAEIHDTNHKKGVVEGQQAMWNDPVPEKITRKVLHERIVGDMRKTFFFKGFDFDAVLRKAKNLSTFATVDNTPQRVMEKTFGYKEGQILADMTVNKVAQNETEGIKWLNSFTDRKNGLLAKISEQYHIKPGSKESAAAQMYAESFYIGDDKKAYGYSDAELAQDFPDKQVQENIKGLARDPRIRRIYDDTLAMLNESRTRNAYPEIPRLDNYFLHFRAMDDTFSRLGLPFNPNDIRAKDLPTDLNGVTADLKPGKPFFASELHREGKRTSFDLLGGLERYLNGAKNQIFHIDDIQNLRALRNYIADSYGQASGLEGLDALSEEEQQDRIEQVYGSHLSTFAKFLNEEANVLAGKTALIDRGLEGVIGRRGMTFLNTVNQQVGKNMVGWNISSSLTNFLPVAQTFAKTNKASFIKAFAQTVSNKVGSIFGKTDGFAENSPVIIRRKGAESFYRTPWQKLSDPGYVIMSAVDNISTELIARAKYNELTKKGMDSQKAHIETDKWVSRLMGDRSLGQQPQLYNSKMLGLVTKFQLEVRNQLDSQFYDTIQEAKASNEQINNGLARNAKIAAKVASTFVQLAVVQHLFGKAFESVAGYNPAFDIISVLIKTLGLDDEEESEDTVLDNIEEGFMELLGDLPYTSTFTGGRIPISSALPIEQFVTGKDDYGNEKSRWETLGEAAPYYLLPGGYGQIKKTIGGLSMFSDKLPTAGSYTDSGGLRFPVEDTIGNRVKAGVFGQWAFPEARDYIENERKPLNEKQTQEFIDVDMPIRDYWDYREGLSKVNGSIRGNKLGRQADYINSLDLPTWKKNLLINNLTDRKEPIDLTDYGNYADFEEFDYAQKNPEKYEFLKGIGVSVKDYNKADEETKNVYSWAYKYPEKHKFLEEQGVSLDDWKNFDDDSKDAYMWAYENPEKRTVAKAVASDVIEYRKYTGELYDIKADKDRNGKSISGSRKTKVAEYISDLDIDDGAKYILFKSEYPSDDTYNNEIIDYLNGRDDITFDEMNTILTELGFKVSKGGVITWD